jgi:hypothetical protein
VRVEGGAVYLMPIDKRWVPSTLTRKFSSPELRKWLQLLDSFA